MQDFGRALFVGFVFTVVHVGADLVLGEPAPIASAINMFVNGTCISWATLSIWGSRD
jgi:hypothetical protein